MNIKFKIPVLVVSLAILLVGCGVIIAPEELEKASVVCENNGGVNHFLVGGNSEPKYRVKNVVCNNGARFSSQHIRKYHEE